MLRDKAVLVGSMLFERRSNNLPGLLRYNYSSKEVNRNEGRPWKEMAKFNDGGWFSVLQDNIRHIAVRWNTPLYTS